MLETIFIVLTGGSTTVYSGKDRMLLNIVLSIDHVAILELYSPLKSLVQKSRNTDLI